ncbi:uncharacterized protein LOC130680197 [Manis pentadactyla]|uniref:uncharacterized protein LOC130680197 n=1 Tax=Manis pentadactyla TaxID=143292 RepID=UPI00255D00AD|nr:uncharacterized protein LOC130680197 [Manis pentadactyla]
MQITGKLSAILIGVQKGNSDWPNSQSLTTGWGPPSGSQENSGSIFERHNASPSPVPDPRQHRPLGSTAVHPADSPSPAPGLPPPAQSTAPSAAPPTIRMTRHLPSPPPHRPLCCRRLGSTADCPAASPSPRPLGSRAVSRPRPSLPARNPATSGGPPYRPKAPAASPSPAPASPKVRSPSPRQHRPLGKTSDRPAAWPTPAPASTPARSPAPSTAPPSPVPAPPHLPRAPPPRHLPPRPPLWLKPRRGREHQHSAARSPSPVLTNPPTP